MYKLCQLGNILMRNCCCLPGRVGERGFLGLHSLRFCCSAGKQESSLHQMVSSHPGIARGALLAWSCASRLASARSVERCARCCRAGATSAPHHPGVFEGCSSELPWTGHVGDPSAGCLPQALTPHRGRGDVPVRDGGKSTEYPRLSWDGVRAEDTEGSDAAAAGKSVPCPAHACTSPPVSLHARVSEAGGKAGPVHGAVWLLRCWGSGTLLRRGERR